MNTSTFVTVSAVTEPETGHGAFAFVRPLQMFAVAIMLESMTRRQSHSNLFAAESLYITRMRNVRQIFIEQQYTSAKPILKRLWDDKGFLMSVRKVGQVGELR